MKNNKDSEIKTQYMPIFMSIGISLGLAIGAAFDNIPIGMCFGLGIGLCIGSAIDAKNCKKSENISQTDEDETE